MSAVLAAAILVATSTACGPKRVVVGGVEMSYEEGAQAVLQQGIQAETEGDRETAKARYRDVLSRFEGSDAEPDALAALGFILHKEKGCDASQLYLSQVVEGHSGHPDAARARGVLDTCPKAASGGATASSGRGESGRYAAYEQRFSAASTPAERRQVASEAADAALAAEDAVAAVRWLVRVHGLETESAQRAALEEEIRDVIETRLGFVDVRQLVESLSPKDFPGPLLRYKLGRIQYHVRDYAGSRESLQAYLRDNPTGPYADPAQKLLDRIQAIATVRPTAIGVLLPLSGEHRSYGELALQSIRLALGVGKDGKGKGFQLVVEDTKSDAVHASDMAEKLIIEDHVIAILGPIFSYSSVPAARTAQQLGTPLLSISTAAELPGLGPYVFRNAMTSKDQVEALVDYAMTIRGMKSFAVLYPQHPYGEEMLQLFWDAVEARKGEIRGVESYAMGDTTFTWQVKRLVARDQLELRYDYRKGREDCRGKDNAYRTQKCIEDLKKNLKPIVDFDGLFIPDYPRTIPMVAAALAFEDIIVETSPYHLRRIEKTLGRKVKPVTLLGGSGWNSPKVTERSGRNVENALFTDGFFAEADDERVAAFVNAYQKAYRRTPRLYPEALFWDSARLLVQVVQTKQPKDREALRLALTQVVDFPGVTGKTSFAGKNDAQREVVILTVKDGTIREVGSPDAAPTSPEKTE